MKKHHFFAREVLPVFFLHCLAFHVIQLINFFILYSFDADNLICSGFVECSFNVLVFFTARGQFELAKFFVARR